MSTFLKSLEGLLEEARERGIVGDEATASLLSLAREHDRDRGVLSLAAVLGALGGVVATVGVILLVAANWSSIPDGIKIGGFLVLFLSVHGTALWIRATGRPLPKTAESLHLLGAGLFLAGVALVAQIYHLDERPPDGVLLWLVATAPLAILLRSGPVTLLTVFALLWWLHFEGSFPGSPVEMPRHGFTPHLMVELGLGTALLAFSGSVRAFADGVAKALCAAGVLLLFCALYTLGFYRYFSSGETSGSLVIPGGALALGAVGLLVGGRRLVPGAPWLRHRLLVLLSLSLALGAWAFASDVGMLPRGPELMFSEFGWNRSNDLAELLVSVAAWVLWVALALWCVAFGTHSGRKAYLNLGVLGVGAMVVTRFFDLMGTQGMTGTFFVLGGIVLLVTGWALEKWRRNVVARMVGAS